MFWQFLWRSSSSAQPGFYAASSSRSGLFLERSLSETSGTSRFYQLFVQTPEKYLIPGNYCNNRDESALGGLLTRHLLAGTHEATNLLSSLELRAACLRELQVAQHLPETSKAPKKNQRKPREGTSNVSVDEANLSDGLQFSQHSIFILWR